MTGMQNFAFLRHRFEYRAGRHQTERRHPLRSDVRITMGKTDPWQLKYEIHF
jgi:hypothetical protein